MEISTLNKIDEVLLDKYNDEGEAENLIKNRNLKLNIDKLKEDFAPTEEKNNDILNEVLKELSNRYSKSELKEIEIELNRIGVLDRYSKENLIDQLTQKSPKETIERLKEVNNKSEEFLKASKLRDKFYEYVENNNFGDERIYELASLLSTTPKDFEDIKNFLDFRKKLGLEYIAERNYETKNLTKEEIYKKGYEKLLDIIYSENTQEFAPEEKPAPIDKYEDYGEKIHGAKKDLWQTYQKALEQKLSDDIEQISLTKDFPEPNYEFLIREGVGVDVLATIKALRDCIPAKPRGKYNSYKRKEYVETVKFVRNLAVQMIKGNIIPSRVKEALNKKHEICELVDLYIGLGYPAFKNAKGIRLISGVQTFYKDGKKLDTPLKNQFMFVKNGRFFGNSFDTREEAIEYMRGILSIEPEKQEKKTKLDIYQVRRTGEIIIGKKVGTNKWIDLKGGFTTSKEAREYYKGHEAELLEQLKKRKETPETRHTANRDRVGEDYREGMNITPEKFASEFGFRGVQFGNYVEQAKRVEDINEAYDALLDLANLLDVPSRALSLNGSLGIAFGARGNGGKFPAKAHYESAEIVINLTKKKGAGSLAHEWWHALDNYFGKKDGSEFGYITEKNNAQNTRKEVLEAFKNIAKVVSKNMHGRSAKIDSSRSKDYWSTTVEMTARAFEAYIIGKAKLKGFTNDYLANILTEQEYNDIELYPYPTENEMSEIIEAYDNLFSLLKTEQTEKGIAFYQGAKAPAYVDLTDEFDKVPTFEEVQKHLYEILDSSIFFKTKTKGYNIDIKQTEEKRAGNKPTNVINKLTKKGNPKKLNPSAIKRNNKYLKVIEKLITNSELKRNQDEGTDGYKNNKKAEKPHVKQYYNFDVPVLIGEIIYTVRLQAEEWKNDKTNNGYKTVHLYNIYETKKSSRLDPKDKMPIKTAREDSNNINKKNNNVNSFNQDEERAKIEFKEQETIITLAKGNDASSFMHELAHLYLHDLQELAKVNKRAQKDLQEVYDILGFDSSKDYSEDEFREMHEKFARSFEAYLLNGQAPTEKMKGIFERFKEFLQQIYESLVDLDVEFSNEVKQCFDRLLTTDEEYEKEVLPMYEKNDELADSINQQNTLSYQIKNNLNAVKDSWKSFYDSHYSFIHFS